MAEVVERLGIVEEALAHFLLRTERALMQLSSEMRDFKDEMKDFKNEMKDFKEEMRIYKDETRADTKAFKEEMKAFREENRQDRKDMNKQWGDLANSFGMLVENIISPAVGPAIRKYFGQEPVSKMIHCQRNLKKTGQKGEFDVVVLTDTHVFVVETKANPDKAKILHFKEKTLPKFRELYPEYENLTLVPIFSSLSFEPELVEAATEEGVYLLAYREWEYMDILNFEAIAGSSPDNAEPK